MAVVTGRKFANVLMADGNTLRFTLLTVDSEFPISTVTFDSRFILEGSLTSVSYYGGSTYSYFRGDYYPVNFNDSNYQIQTSNYMKGLGFALRGNNLISYGGMSGAFPVMVFVMSPSGEIGVAITGIVFDEYLPDSSKPANITVNDPSQGNAGYYLFTPQEDFPYPFNLFNSVLYSESVSAELKRLLEIIEPVLPDTDPYSGIDGEGDLPGDTVGLPDEPSLSALDAGMFALFSPTSGQMKALASYLWTDFGGAGTDVVQMLGEVVEALKRTVANPLDLVLGLSIIASQGLSKGGASNVHVGFWDTGVSMTRLAKQYFSVDCGSVSFSPVCGDTFLDYAPYSKFSIFLPYVGMKTLDANDVVGHSISVKYRGDCVTGGLACYLLRDGAVIAEYSGSCALNLPLSSENWGATISSAIAIAAGGAAGAIAGGAAGAAAGAIEGAASVASNPSVLAPQIQYNGAVAGGAGHMASQKPFILREVVRFHSTSYFNTVSGYPSYYYRQLGDCSGFTQVVDVHLFGLTATADEVAEIERLLKEGVIL